MINLITRIFFRNRKYSWYLKRWKRLDEPIVEKFISEFFLTYSQSKQELHLYQYDQDTDVAFEVEKFKSRTGKIGMITKIKIMMRLGWELTKED